MRVSSKALVRLIPDLIVLGKRLVADPRVPRRAKIWLVVALAYLALPFDLVPDFVPILGQLDAVIVVGLILRHALRTCPVSLMTQHWPGPPDGLRLVLRFAGRSPE